MAGLRGTPGHPNHPPLTDVSIGSYTVAAALAAIGLFGGIESQAAIGMWLALIVGLGFALPTAGTGLLDWLDIPKDTPPKKTATWHMVVMLAASSVFLIAAIAGYSGFDGAGFDTTAAIVTLVGYGVLTLGGWLGGTIVFVHGVRVINQPERPANEAVTPMSERRTG